MKFSQVGYGIWLIALTLACAAVWSMVDKEEGPLRLVSPCGGEFCLELSSEQSCTLAVVVENRTARSLPVLGFQQC
jgi:hypothetical protein